MAETPSKGQVQLGAELKILREMAGLKQEQLRERLVAAGHPVPSQPAMSRYEKGHQRPSRALVEAWARLTNASDGDRNRVLALAEMLHGETRPYADMDDIGHLQGVAARREEEARRIRDCALTWLPGLCQTAEYARLFIPQVDPDESIDHAAAVVARLERQQLLYREGRRFEFLISEHALRWAPAAGVMAGQRAHLASIAELGAVDLRILPSSRIGHPEWINFTIYDPANGDDPYVANELPNGGQTLTETKTVGHYLRIWDDLCAVAVHGDEAVALIRG